MRRILIDAGPVIALFDRSDSYHERAVSFIKNYQGSFYSTWPVITEASHMLDFSTRVQMALLEWINRGGIKLFELDSYDLSRIIELSAKFQDVPMDLADATLVAASESLGISEIASVDGDFYIYRDLGSQYLTNVFL